MLKSCYITKPTSDTQEGLHLEVCFMFKTILWFKFYYVLTNPHVAAFRVFHLVVQVTVSCSLMWHTSHFDTYFSGDELYYWGSQPTDGSVITLSPLQLPPGGSFNTYLTSLFCCQKLVIENMDVLVQMRNNFDKPEEMANLKKRLSGERWTGEHVGR